MSSEGPTPPDALGPDDRRLLDHLLQSGFDPDSLDELGPAGAEHGRRLLDLLGLLNDYPVEDPDDTLVYATLARIDRADEARRERMRLEPTVMAREGLRRRRIPDLITAASIILIASAIIIPMTAQLRGRSIDFRCEQNLRQVHLGLAQYGEDYGGQMPVAFAGVGLATKMLDFAPVVAGSYCDHHVLDCPGADHDHVGSSYSRQVPTDGGEWAKSVAMVGDRNPLVDAYRAQLRQVRSAPSVNHGGRGQNVLVGDGSIIWLETAYLSPSDCIWLPEGHDQVEPGLGPASARDSFLIH